MLLFFTVECIYFFLFFWHILGKGMKKWRHTESFFETNRASSGALNKVGAPLRYLTKIEFRTGCDAKSNFRPPASYNPPLSPILFFFFSASRGFRIQSLILGRLSTRSAHILQGYGINSAPFVPCPCHSNASDTPPPLSQHTLKAWALHLAGEKRKDRQEKHLSPGFASLTSIRASAIFDHVLGVDTEVESR